MGTHRQQRRTGGGLGPQGFISHLLVAHCCSSLIPAIVYAQARGSQFSSSLFFFPSCALFVADALSFFNGNPARSVIPFPPTRHPSRFAFPIAFSHLVAPTVQHTGHSSSTQVVYRLSLCSNELEYLYTGKGFREAFEFRTSDSREEGDAEENRIDKLRKDLVFMRRSRLYPDIRIALTGNFSSTNHKDSTAIFSSQRFMLVSPSPYFLSALSWGGPTESMDPVTLNLPSPPFAPASLHFTLGYIYAGTLIFSHRTYYDLDTTFHIMRATSYLALDSLYNEVQARIVQEMMHGLFHTFLEFAEHERITGGKRGTGGCRCRQCARRVPRVLEFACADDGPVLTKFQVIVSSILLRLHASNTEATMLPSTSRIRVQVWELPSPPLQVPA
jgi:hypothetical protein